MKLITYSTIFLLTFLLFSCEDCEQTDPILGTWAVKNMLYSNCENSNQEGFESYSTTMCDRNDMDCEHLQFNFYKDSRLQIISFNSRGFNAQHYSFVIENDSLLLCDVRHIGYCEFNFKTEFSGEELHLQGKDEDDHCDLRIELVRVD